MRLAAIASLTAHAAAIAALATFDWRATEFAPAIPVAVLVAPALGDQANPPARSNATADAGALPPAGPNADGTARPALELSALLSEPAGIVAPAPATAPAPKPVRQAAKPAPAPGPAPAPLRGEQNQGSTPAALPPSGGMASPPPASAPVVEHGPALLPGNSVPAYPPIARRRALEGRAVVRATVAADGRVASVELVRSSAHELLDRAALDAVRDWRFAPARRGEEPIAGAVDIPVVFRLED